MTEKLHIETSGEGPPLVLLHGWAMHSGMWGPLVGALGRRYRVDAVDLPGHGYSRPLAPFTLDGAVVSLVEAFDGDDMPLTVVGWSLGALVAMRWALLRPHHVMRLILVGASPRFTADDGWPHAMSRETLIKFGDELQVAWKVTVDRFLGLQVLGSEHGRSALALLRKEIYARGVPLQGTLADALDVLLTADLRDAAPTITQPALVVAGSRDALTPPQAGRWLAGHLAHARLAVIEGAGHAPFLSHPDPFCRAIEEFLDAR